MTIEQIKTELEKEISICEDCPKPLPDSWKYPHCPSCLQARITKWESSKGEITEKEEV